MVMEEHYRPHVNIPQLASIISARVAAEQHLPAAHQGQSNGDRLIRKFVVFALEIMGEEKTIPFLSSDGGTCRMPEMELNAMEKLIHLPICENVTK